MGLAAFLVGATAILIGLERVSNEAPESVGEPAATAPAANPAAPAVDPDLGHPANRNLRINDAGLAIIKQSEGLRLDAYQSGGRWFIGYGHSGAAPGSHITEAEADRLLRQDVAGAEAGVRRLVMVPVNDNEFSAMVSLAYNLGVGGFSRSSVLERLNAGDHQGAADAFRLYVRAGYQVIEHLKQRREKERALFLAPA
jgi:lysozyme